MLKNLLFLSAILIPGLSSAQEGNWGMYMAKFDEGVGSVTLNMGLINTAPLADKPFVVITGVITTNCREDGFPNSDEFDKLYQISDAVEETLALKTSQELAGTFTLQCERLGYYYVKDTTGLRQALQTLYSTKFSQYQYYLNIKEDRDWKAYREFLYPSEEILEDMENRAVLEKLIEAGDDLTKARPVDHWLYFSSNQDRKAFISYAKQQGYKIEETGKSEGRLPFQLRISRTDKVDPASINAQTLALKKEARKHKGNYDGWETFVMK